MQLLVSGGIMPDALIFYGNELRFLDPVMKFYRYLKLDSRIGTVSVLPALSKDLPNLIRRELDCLKASQPMLIVYCGHGTFEGWKCSIFYNDLAKILSRSNKKILIVNHCCYSGGLIPYLEDNFVSPRKVGILSPCPADKKAYGEQLLHEILRSWESKKVFKTDDRNVSLCGKSTEQVMDGATEIAIGQEVHRQTRIRWGAVLDPYFFPKN
jgi:hypothetical protein